MDPKSKARSTIIVATIILAVLAAIALISFYSNARTPSNSKEGLASFQPLVGNQEFSNDTAAELTLPSMLTLRIKLQAHEVRLYDWSGFEPQVTGLSYYFDSAKEILFVNYGVQDSFSHYLMAIDMKDASIGWKYTYLDEHQIYFDVVANSDHIYLVGSLTIKLDKQSGVVISQTDTGINWTEYATGRYVVELVPKSGIYTLQVKRGDALIKEITIE